MTPLERAIEVVGGVGALAGSIGVSASAPSMWMARQNVPAEHCPAIERETRRRGQVVSCEELRPDVPWCVLRENASDGAPGADAMKLQYLLQQADEHPVPQKAAA